MSALLPAQANRQERKPSPAFASAAESLPGEHAFRTRSISRSRLVEFGIWPRLKAFWTNRDARSRTAPAAYQRRPLKSHSYCNVKSWVTSTKRPHAVALPSSCSMPCLHLPISPISTRSHRVVQKGGDYDETTADDSRARRIPNWIWPDS